MSALKTDLHATMEHKCIGISTSNKYSNRNKANLHWYKCAFVQVFKCERQIVALCHQLFKHCIQLSGVTVTTHDI